MNFSPVCLYFNCLVIKDTSYSGGHFQTFEWFYILLRNSLKAP